MSQLVLSGVGALTENITAEATPALTPGAGEAVVALEAASINPADFLRAMGWYGLPPVVGAVLGNEGVGRVTAVGPDVDSALIGRRVIFVVDGEQGVWADRTVAPVRNLIPVGEEGDAIQLAQLAVNPLTAQVLLTRFADLKAGDWVGQTIGNSAVGQFVVQLAKRAGYRTVSVVRSEAAAEQVRALGGDIVVLSGDGLAGRIASALGGEQLSLVLDGEGGATASEVATSLVSGGTVVGYSSATGAPTQVGVVESIYRGITVKGWWIVSWLASTPRAEVEAVYASLEALLVSGELRGSVDSTFSLAEYPVALERAQASGRTGKVLFTFDSGR